MRHKVTFKFALEGIKYALATQPNFRIHSVLGLTAVIIGFIIRLAAYEWLMLVFTITLVFISEMINTSLEAMTDLIEEKHHRRAKIAKDVSAGMVLISAISAIIVGLVIFIPKIL